jgi:hypothetical protein
MQQTRGDALDELAAAVEEIGAMLDFAAQVLSESGLRRPY